MGYNGNVTVECWKVHTCVNCTSVLRYPMVRKVTASGNSQEQCRQNLNAAAVKAMNEGVDLHPCPTCGMVQPEMVGARRTGTLGCMSGVGALLALGMAIGLASEMPISTVMLEGGFVAFLVAAVALLTVLQNPNDNLQKNQRQGQTELDGGKLLHEGQENPAAVPNPRMAHVTDGKHVPAFACLALALALMALPEVVRGAKGWTANANFFPAVIGPGDQATYYFHRQITSIKGYWKGQVEARLGGEKLSATCKDNQWGDSISVKSSEKADTADLWTTLTLPDDPKLAGQTQKLALTVDYTAPVMMGSGSFKEEEGKVEETPEITFSTPGAGTTYRNLAWIGALAGCGLLAVGCFWLSRRAAGLQGNPVHTLVKE